MNERENKYNIAIQGIVNEQYQIIGPMAYELAKQASGVGWSGQDVEVSGDPKAALQEVVMQFYRLFGNTSVLASFRAIKKQGLFFSREELPEILQTV